MSGENKVTSNNKRLLDVISYLWAYADKDNPVTITDIDTYFKDNGIDGSTKAIASILKDLEAWDGFELKHKASTQNRYYFSKRVFDENDIKALADIISATYTISDANRDRILSELQLFLDPSVRENIAEHIATGEFLRTGEDSVLENVDSIADIIANNQVIQFNYLEIDDNGNRKYKHNGKKYEVSPYALAVNDGKYYVAGYQHDENIVKTYRVDRMDNILYCRKPGIKTPEDFDKDEFANRIGMMQGEYMDVVLLCDNEVKSAIAEQFGKQKFIKAGDSSFKVQIHQQITSTFFGWVMGFGGKIKIVGPEAVVEQYKSLFSSTIK